MDAVGTAGEVDPDIEWACGYGLGEEKDDDGTQAGWITSD